MRSAMCSAIANAEVAAGDGGVPDVQDAVRGGEQEVVHERAVSRDRLRPNSRGRWEEICAAQLGQVPPRLRRIGPTDEVAVELDQARSPVTPREAVKPRIAQRVPGFAEAEIAAAIPLPGERHDGVRPRPDLAVRPSIDVHAQKRKAWVRDRVDQVPAEPPGLRPERKVVTAEREDSHVSVDTGQGIGVHASTGDHAQRGEFPLRGLDSDLVGPVLDSQDPRSAHQAPAGPLDPPEERPRNVPVVDEAGGRNMERGDAGAVRLELAQAVGSDALDGDAVRQGALVQALEPRKLIRVDRDNHLAADLVGHALGVAEVDQEGASPGAEASLQRPWLVIDA